MSNNDLNHSHVNDKNNTPTEPLTTDQLISLISIYESELEYRDNILYSRMFTLSYISLLIMILPFWNAFFVSSLPRHFIIVVGIVNEFLTFFISIIHANRLDCTSTTYRFLLDCLPDKYRKITIEESIKLKDKKVTQKFLKKLNKKTVKARTILYKQSLTYLSPISLCLGVIVIGCFLFFYV